MIIFADQNLAGYLMNASKAKLMNLFSNVIVGDACLDVVPPKEIIALYYESNSERDIDRSSALKEEFRKQYLSYLCEFKPFMGIMDIIVADSMVDDNIAILTDLSSDMVCNVVELISQFIYDRWHYEVAIVYTREDLENVNVVDVDPDYLGVYNADIDFYARNVKKEGNSYE